MHKLCVGCGTQGAAADCSANHAGPARSQKNLEGPLRGAHPPTHGDTAQLAAFSSSHERSEKTVVKSFWVWFVKRSNQSLQGFRPCS